MDYKLITASIVVIIAVLLLFYCYSLPEQIVEPLVKESAPAIHREAERKYHELQAEVEYIKRTAKPAAKPRDVMQNLMIEIKAEGDSNIAPFSEDVPKQPPTGNLPSHGGNPSAGRRMDFRPYP